MSKRQSVSSEAMEYQDPSYRARWHARVTRAYAYAIARARTERAWASKRALHRHAYAVACAEARELAASDRNALKSLQAWAEIYFDAPPFLGGHFEWTTAVGPARGLSGDPIIRKAPSTPAS